MLANASAWSPYAKPFSVIFGARSSSAMVPMLWINRSLHTVLSEIRLPWMYLTVWERAVWLVPNGRKDCGAAHQFVNDTFLCTLPCGEVNIRRTHFMVWDHALFRSGHYPAAKRRNQHRFFVVVIALAHWLPVLRNEVRSVASRTRSCSPGLESKHNNVNWKKFLHLECLEWPEWDTGTLQLWKSVQRRPNMVRVLCFAIERCCQSNEGLLYRLQANMRGEWSVS